MISRLRRLRLLALLLVGGTPGLGGTALQAVHPCPEEMPWLGGAAGEHEHHAGDSGATPGPTTADGCHCVGNCAVSATPGLGTAPAVLARTTFLRVEAVPYHHAPGAALLPIDRFPPKTAPPLGSSGSV